jgi:hypothetical protein
VVRFCCSIGCWLYPAARLRYSLLADRLSACSNLQIAHSREDGEDNRQYESGHIIATRLQPGRAGFLVFELLESAYCTADLRLLHARAAGSCEPNKMSFARIPGRARLAGVSLRLRALTTWTNADTFVMPSVNLLQLHAFLSIRCLPLPPLYRNNLSHHAYTDDETNPCCPHLHKLTHPNPKVCRPATDQKIQIPH